MTDLERAIKLAVEAHAGQVDKSGQPYILHPLRVMMAMEDEQDRIAAVLHDVVEDGNVGHGDILAMFGPDIHDALVALSRQETNETYYQFIARAKLNSIARRVKIADIRDNLRPGAPGLVERYKFALHMLEAE